MAEAVIVGAVRTAVARKNGRLSPVRPDDLAALVLQELVKRVGIDATEVQDVILGCVDGRALRAADDVHRLRTGHRHDHRAALRGGRGMAGFRCAKCGKVAMAQRICCGRPMKKV